MYDYELSVNLVFLLVFSFSLLKYLIYYINIKTYHMNDQDIFNINLIDALGLQHLPDDQKIQFLQNIATIVQKSGMVRI